MRAKILIGNSKSVTQRCRRFVTDSTSTYTLCYDTEMGAANSLHAPRHNTASIMIKT